MRRVLPSLSVLVSLAACAHAVPDAGAGAGPGGAIGRRDVAPAAVIRLEPYIAGLLTARVAVGDTSLPFLFDTGGGASLYTPPSARAEGCEPFGRVTGFRHDGEAVTMRRCPAAVLEIDGWAAPAGETEVFDLMGLLPDGVPVLGGLLALRTFDGLPLTLELFERRVIVESPGSFRRRIAGMAEVPARAARQGGGSSLDIFLAVEADGGPVWMELDSGNTGSVLVAPHAAAQLGLALDTDEARTVTVRLAGFGPVEVRALEKEMIYDGVLNAGFLRTHRVTLDLAASRAWVEAAGPE